MATLRQLHANRLNALKSTGPKTADGKDRARRNGLLHGITASVVFPDEQAVAVGERYAELESSLRPWNVLEGFYLEQVASLNVRLDRCKQAEAVLREQAALRAITCWDEDRAAEAAALGADLPRRPEAVVTLLKTARHGCDWLAARWSGLGRDLDHLGEWTDPLRGRALDLLGVPPEERGGPSLLDPPPGIDPAAHRRALVAAQLDRLAALKAEALDEADESAREAASVGLGPEPAAPLALLRRYEQSLERRLQWYLSQFQRRDRPSSRRPAPAPIPRLPSPPPPEPPFPPATPAEIAAAAPPADPEPAAAPPAPVPAGAPAATVGDRPKPGASLLPGRPLAAILAAPHDAPPPNRQARRAAAAISRHR